MVNQVTQQEVRVKAELTSNICNSCKFDRRVCKYCNVSVKFIPYIGENSTAFTIRQQYKRLSETLPIQEQLQEHYRKSMRLFRSTMRECAVPINRNIISAICRAELHFR